MIASRRDSMRIACLVPSILPYGVEIANAVALRHEVQFVTTSPGRDLLADPNSASLRRLLRELLAPSVVLQQLPYRLLRDPHSIIQPFLVARIIRRWQPDVVHLQHTSDPRICTAVWLLRSLPLVVTVHDVNWQHGAKRQRREFMLEWPLRLADATIVHGETLRRLYLRTYPFGAPERVHVIPHGAYSLYAKLRNPTVIERPNTVLFFGRMHPYKGLDTMIRAARIMAQTCPTARIIVAGTGPVLTERRAELDSLGNVDVICRFLENQEVAELFQRAAVVAVPYEEASQSGVVALAYAFGKPVVATAVGALPEAVIHEETGYLAPAGDASAVARAILNLLRDKARRREMRSNIERRVKSELSWESIARATATVYEQAMEHKRNGKR